MTIGQFDFPSCVRSHFSFLENEFEYHFVRDDPDVVRYESNFVFVSVFYDRLSLEQVALGIAIALLDPARRDRTGYSMDRLVRLAGANDSKPYYWPTARTETELDTAVEKLANELRFYGGHALRGDVRVFDTMFTTSEMDREKDHADFVRPRADAAFREKAYSKAVVLYESMKGHRTPAEEQKLAYARKHCASENRK